MQYMNNNTLIGALAAVVIIGGGAWLLSNYMGSGTATSTPQAATGNGTPTTQTQSAPVVTTGSLVVASNSTALLTGKIYPNGAQTSYWYEYGRTSSLGSRTDTQNIGSGYTNIDAPGFLTGLSPNTSYNFRLVAQNSAGTVSGAIVSFTTNNNPPVAGSSPTLQTDAATVVTNTGARLNGRVNPNSASTIYWFEYGDSSNLGNVTAFQSAGTGSASINASVTLSGLAPGTKFFFRLNAQNQFGTVNGATLVFTTSGTPVAPQQPVANTVSATNIASTSATLNGAVNPNGGSTAYWFEYSSGSTLDILLGTTARTVLANSSAGMTNVSMNLSGLSPNTTYSYRLVAENPDGLVGGSILTFKTRPN